MPNVPLIVVVDDDADLRAYMLEVLALHGYQVLAWPGARGAPARIRQALPALVIVDLCMEHPTAGLEVVRHVRADPVTAAIPVILYSGALQILDGQREDLRAASVRLLPKPFALNELIALVEATLGSGHRKSASPE